jgi:hypothetical protein
MRAEFVSIIVAGLTLAGVVVNIVLTHRLSRKREREGLVWRADVEAWLRVEAAATRANEIVGSGYSLNGSAEAAHAYLEELEDLIGHFGRYPEVVQGIRDYLQQARYVLRLLTDGGPVDTVEADELAPDLENAFIALLEAGAGAFGAPLARRAQPASR